MEATLGKRITANRKRLGLTQDQLAEKLGLTAQAVSKWENDLSCPDISILPKLADIFGITTDELLGRAPAVPVCETEVVYEEKEENGFTFDNGKMNFHWDGGRMDGLSLACWVIFTGILYLVARLTHIEVSFWNVLWPTFLVVFGLFGIYPKFSAFRLGCALVGGYFLVDKMALCPVQIDSGILVAVAVLLFGLSLLADTLRKRKTSGSHPGHTYTHNGYGGNEDNNYQTDGNHFTYDANFGSSTQLVQLDKLQSGRIDVNFGEYTVDLTGVEELDAGCKLDAECNFGTLTILVPKHFAVVPDSSTSFAGFEINGQPDSASRGTIYLSASVSFGTICIRYI